MFSISLFIGTYNGRDRTALAVSCETDPNLAVCSCVNGKGLVIFDLRRPLPIEFVNEVLYSAILTEYTTVKPTSFLT